MDQDTNINGPHQGRSRTAFYIVAALIAAAVAFGIWLASQPLYPVGDDSAELWDAGVGSSDWAVYVLDKGEKTALTYAGKGDFTGLLVDGQTFFAQRLLTEDFEQALLFIDSPYRFAVFLNGKLLYSQEPLADDMDVDHMSMSGQLSGAAQPAVVSLPEGYAGSVLTIAQAQRGADLPEKTVHFGPVTLTGQARYSTSISAEALRATYPAILLLVLAMVLAGIFLYSAYRAKPDASALYLFFCTLLWTGSVLCTSDVLHIYYGWTGPLSQLFYYDGFAFLFLFLAEQMRRFARLMYVAAAAYAVIFVLGLLAEYFFPAGETTEELASLPQLLTLPVLAIAVLLSFIEARHGSRLNRLFCRLFVWGLVVYMCCVMVSCIRSGVIWTSFLDEMRSGFESWRFTYLLDVLRYILAAACFACTVVQFVHLAAEQSANRLLVRERVKMADEQRKDLERQARKEASARSEARRHLSTAAGYIEANSPDLAQLYLQQAGVALERNTVPVDTKNTVVDTILNAKIYQARENGIEINVQTGLLPKNLPLTASELSAVLINTLDNAIEAARRSAEKTIAVKIYMNNGFFCYRCENSTKYMAAADDTGEGYGLQIVEEIADAHDAALIFEQGQRTFVLSLAFPATPSARDQGWSPAI